MPLPGRTIGISQICLRLIVQLIGEQLNPWQFLQFYPAAKGDQATQEIFLEWIFLWPQCPQSLSDPLPQLSLLCPTWYCNKVRIENRMLWIFSQLSLDPLNGACPMVQGIRSMTNYNSS